MTERFEKCLALLLQHEGGYVDHPSDPGGATNLGVTLGALSDWLGRPASKAEVKALTPERVAPIYRKNYWDAIKGDDLPAGVDYITFDLAVNSGINRAGRYLQEAVGAAPDGNVGPKTIAALRTHPARAVVEAIALRRAAFYRGLATFPTFGKGWLRRLSEVKANALEMAS